MDDDIEVIKCWLRDAIEHHGGIIRLTSQNNKFCRIFFKADGKEYVVEASHVEQPET